jgi:carbon-monoxide dehydrogenase small subunit
MIMVARDLLARNAAPSDQDICHALDGNFCRCTGYLGIVEAVKHAAKIGAGARS